MRAAVLLLIGACAGGRPQAPRASSTPSLQSERDSYQAQSTPAGQHVRIVATYRNTTQQALYVPRCGSALPNFILERFSGGVWRRTYSPICELVGLPAVTVAPGRETVDTQNVLFVTNEPYGPLPRYRFADIPGRYRIVYGVFSGAEPDRHRVFDPLPVSARTSNEFRISVAAAP